MVVPGHEPAGEVVEVGEGARGLAVGDRVAVYLAVGCGFCRYCLSGDRMLCPTCKFLGFQLDGGDAEYVLAPVENCMKLPDSVSFEVGAVLTDMVGTQFRVQQRLDVSGASTVAIIGLGPMGGAGVMVAHALGARVIAVDMLEARLSLAREVGADELVNGAQEDVVARLRELTGGEGVDVAIDCSGNPAGQNASLDAARKLGAVGWVGESRSTTINPSDQILRKLLRVVGGWYFPLWQFPDIAGFAVEKQLPVEALITHRFAIDDAAEAFRLFDQRQTEKAVFVWD
jgi:propanol-preferring alcohol dehydrogenase